MDASVAVDAVKPGNRLNQLDPTGEVDLEDPIAVEVAIRSIFARLYGNGYDAPLLSRAIRDVVAAYRGAYPGLLRCDTLYHDLRHALETGLTTARLLDGHAKSVGAASPLAIDAAQALFCVLLALFHDVGLLRRETEAHLAGAALMPTHEERGVEFMRDYLAATTLAPLARQSSLILATKLVYKMPDAWSALERRMASMIATADLLSQCSDRCYLEKCRDFLFVEFMIIGLAGEPGSVYPDRETLLAKTPGFIAGIFRQRLDEEFRGAYRLLALHTGRGNPWQEAIGRNLAFLEGVLPSHDLSRLRRQPQVFV